MHRPSSAISHSSAEAPDGPLTLTRRTGAVAAAALLVGVVALAFLIDTATGDLVRRTPQQRAVAIAATPCITGRQSMSSGFLVDDRTILTVAHALFESQDFAVRDRDGEWHEAEIIRLDLDRDLAVLRAPTLRSTPVDVARADGGDAITMVDGAASATISGEVVRRVRITTEAIGSDRETRRSGYEIRLDIKPGDSGSAIVDDRGGLVGVVFAESGRRQGRTWITSSVEFDRGLAPAPVPGWECPLRGLFELERPLRDDLRQPTPERLAG